MFIVIKNVQKDLKDQTGQERDPVRARVTGRYIHKEKLLSSIQKTKTAIEVLGPLADFVAKINYRGCGNCDAINSSGFKPLGEVPMRSGEKCLVF